MNRRAGPRPPASHQDGSTTRRLITSLSAVVVVLAAGTLGYWLLGFSPLDALFQTVITVTTVGYGELHRFGAAEKVFTIVLILVGVGTAAYAFGAFIETFIEGYLGGTLRRRSMERKIGSMSAHVILCGWGRVGTAIARSLQAHQTNVVVVDVSETRLATVGGPYVLGDATDEEVLRRAGIERARVLITALSADADNLYVTLTGRSLRPDLFVVARAASQQAVPKLLQAGADRVVNPQELGGARMAALAVQPHVAEFLDVVMHEQRLEFRLEEVEVPRGSPLAGETLRSARVHDRTGTLVLAMKAPDGSFRTNPPPTAEIKEEEILIVIGDVEQVAALRSLAGPTPFGKDNGG